MYFFNTLVFGVSENIVDVGINSQGPNTVCSFSLRLKNWTSWGLQPTQWVKGRTTKPPYARHYLFAILDGGRIILTSCPSIWALWGAPLTILGAVQVLERVDQQLVAQVQVQQLHAQLWSDKGLCNNWEA